MSTQRHLTLVTALIVVALAIGRIPSGWTQQAPAAGLKIGVVNMKEVFTQYSKAKVFEEQLDKEKKAEEASIQELEKNMKSLMDQIDTIRKDKPDSELLKEYREKLVTMEALRRYRAESWNDIVKDRINQNTAAMYNDIRTVIDQYARTNAYDLILKTETGKLETDTEESANQRIARRSVLFSSPNFDVTNQIIAELNR
ncbi:MAG: OmpH family outer membrane protein [Planctomycetes bacterium]|nr:OmpH family outer membrane protein [Planctomycetota bacterium]